jgi:hypothetical protein
MKPDEKYLTEVNCATPNGNGEFRYDFCDCSMTPVVYTSLCIAKNAPAVILESPPSRRGQPVTDKLSAADTFFY